MATPTPVTTVWTLGTRTCVSWQGIWAATDNFATEVVVDLSTLTGYTSALRIKKIQMSCSPGIAADLTLNQATDAIVASCALGCTFVSYTYDGHPQGGPTAPSSGTGDLMLATRSAASGDEIFIYVECETVT